MMFCWHEVFIQHFPFEVEGAFGVKMSKLHKNSTAICLRRKYFDTKSCKLFTDMKGTKCYYSGSFQQHNQFY